MSEIVRCSRFSSGTSSCPGDRWVWPKGGSVVVLQERWGWRGPCPSAAVCEGVRAAEWGGERVNGWLSEGREQIRRSLTDREGSYSDQHRSRRTGPYPPPHTHTHTQPRPVVAPQTSGAQPDAGLSSLHDCISGQIFYLIPDKVLLFFFVCFYSNYHMIFFEATYSGCLLLFSLPSLKWRPGMKSGFLFKCAGKYQKISKDILYCMHGVCILNKTEDILLALHSWMKFIKLKILMKCRLSYTGGNIYIKLARE